MNKKWPCNGTAYITLNERQPPTSFNEIIYKDNGYEFRRLFSIPLQLNGVGFARSDGYMYAVGREDSDIYRIFADGSYEWVYHQDGINKWYLGAGACSRHGKYLVQQQGDFDCYLYSVNPFELEEKFKLTWHPSSGQNGVVDVRFRDFAFDPNNPDIVYAHQRNEPEDDGPTATRGYMFKFNVDPDHPEFAQLKTLFEIPADIAANFGAMFFGPGGDLYGYGRPTGTQIQNTLYQIELDQEECTLEDTGDGADNADGCSCVSDLHLTKTVGENIYQCGDTACFTLQLVNIGLDTVDDVRLLDTFDRMRYHSIEVLNDNWSEWNLIEQGSNEIIHASTDHILPGDTLTVTVCLKGISPGEYCNRAVAEGRTISQVITQQSDDPSKPGFLDQTCFDVRSPDPALNEDAFCKGSSATYTMVEPDVEILEWKLLTESDWLEPPVYFASFQNSDAGLYEARLDDGQCVWRDTFKLDLLDGPEAEYQDVYTGYVGTGIPIIPINMSADIIDWKWIPDQGLSCTDCPDPVASDSSQTDYQLIVTNQNGCTDTMQIEIEWETIVKCNGQAFITQRHHNQDRTELFEIDLDQNNVMLMPRTEYPVYLNGIGMNPTTQSMYAVAPETKHIYRLETDGTHNIIHTESSVPAFDAAAGDCSDYDQYVLYDKDLYKLFVYNLQPFVLDRTIQLIYHPSTGQSGDANFAIIDLAFDPQRPDILYTFRRNVGSPKPTKGWILSFNIDPDDPDFAQVKKVMKIPDQLSVAMGALFFGPTGHLYGYGRKSVGEDQQFLYQMDLHQKKAEIIAEGPGAYFIDGCSCMSGLMIDKSVRNEPIKCTDTVIFDIELRWQGREIIRDLVVRDTMPNTWNATIQSSSGAWENITVTNEQAGTIVSWFADQIEPGDTLRTSIAVSGISPGSYCNQAFVSGNTPSRSVFQPSDDTTTNDWNDPTCFEVLPAEDITDEVSWNIESACTGGNNGSITLYWDGFNEDSLYVIEGIDTLAADKDSLHIPDLSSGTYNITQISQLHDFCPRPVDLQLEVTEGAPSIGYPDSSFCASSPVFMQPDLGDVELIQWQPIGATEWWDPPVQFDAFESGDAGDYMAHLTNGTCEWMSIFTLDLADPPSAEYLDQYAGVTGNGAYLHPIDLSPDIISWEWIPAAGLSCADCPDPIALDSNQTNYQVIITNAAGCSDTIPVEIEWQNNTNQWPCNGGALISLNNDDNTTTGISRVQYRNDGYHMSPATSIPEALDGIGYSRRDGYLYALDRTSADIYRIHSDGTYEKAYVQDGINRWMDAAGACSQTGHYLVQNNESSVCYLYELYPFELQYSFELRWHPSTGMSGTADLGFSDFAFDPGNPDVVYAHLGHSVSSAPPGSRGYLYRFNVDPAHPDFAELERVFRVPASKVDAFGALFFGPNEMLYGYGRTDGSDQYNSLFAIDRQQQTVEIITVGQGADNADACACVSNLIVHKSVPDRPLRCDDTIRFDIELIWRGQERLDAVYVRDTITDGTGVEMLSSSPAWEHTSMDSNSSEELVLEWAGAYMDPGDTLRASFAISGLATGNYCNQALAGGQTPIRSITRTSDDAGSTGWNDPTCFEVRAPENIRDSIQWWSTASCVDDSAGAIRIQWDALKEGLEYVFVWETGTDTVRLEEDGNMLITDLSPGEYRLNSIGRPGNRCFKPVEVLMEVPTWQDITAVPDEEFCRYANTTILTEWEEVEAWKTLDGTEWRNPPLHLDNYQSEDSGLYEVKMSNDYCSWRDTFRLGMAPRPWAEYQSVYAVHVDDEVRLVPDSFSVDITQWQWLPEQGLSCTDCPDPVVTDTLHDSYNVLVTNASGCTDTVRVRVEFERDATIYVPNVFTPNRDGINDVFTVFPSERVLKIEEVEIFNRWGDRVYHHYGRPQWDGRFNGQRAQQGVYLIQLTYRTVGGVEKVFAVDVTLVR